MIMRDIILDLCGGTGSWSLPWKQAGYNVRVVTLPEYDVRDIGFGDGFISLRNGRYFEVILTSRIYGILAAPPCTEFSVLNCIAEARERDEEKGMEIVNACLRVIEHCKPVFWALENPRGHLRKYLGTPRMTFQPWQYGDPWTKATDIWGNYSLPPPLYKKWEDVPKLPLYTRPNRDKPNFAYLHKSAWKDIPQLAYHEPTTDAEFRAMTPPGFAKAFYEANKEDDKIDREFRDRISEINCGEEAMGAVVRDECVLRGEALGAEKAGCGILAQADGRRNEYAEGEKDPV